MRRANIGCGSIRPTGWDNFDIEDWDVRYPLRNCELQAMERRRPLRHQHAHCTHVVDLYDYVAAHHVLMGLDHLELVPALRNIRAVLKPGGRLRISDMDLIRGVAAHIQGDEAWFPQDHRTGSIDAKLCTWVTWFGTRKSVFNGNYLTELLYEAGFVHVDSDVSFGRSHISDPGATDLDSRENESLFLEAVR